MRMLLVMRLSVQGFIVSEHLEVWPQALGELGRGRGQRPDQVPRDHRRGASAAPEAFIGMLRGTNFGKQLVKLV